MESNIDVVRTFYDALSNGDMGSLFCRFAPQIDWREADGIPYADRNPYRTPQDVATGVLARIGADWDGFMVVPESFASEGGLVVMLGRYKGTNRTTGKPLDVPVAHAWTVKEGAIRAFRQYVDTVLVRRAMQGPAATFSLPAYTF
ncbi:MAG TPA: nuclear transport factor 2 family protein [Tepidiformaceae bacterium]